MEMECLKCKQPIVVDNELIEESGVIECENCGAQYFPRKEQGELTGADPVPTYDDGPVEDY
jgi:DNA-directed RNA polymerase subunit RPC12/RpoP